MACHNSKSQLFRGFRTSADVIRLAVMLYVRFPLSLRNVEDLLHERGIDLSPETVRFWWHRFGPLFAFEIRRSRAVFVLVEKLLSAVLLSLQQDGTVRL